MPNQKRKYQPIHVINYLFAVSDAGPFERSVFQGFTPSVFDYIPLYSDLTALPPDCFLPCLDQPFRLAFHAAGIATWKAIPASVPSLISLKTEERLDCPFTVIFTNDNPTTETIAKWISNQEIPVLHVTRSGQENSIAMDALSQDRIREYCRSVIEALGPYFEVAPLDRLRSTLDGWLVRGPDKTAKQFPSHLTTLPNIMSLRAGGYILPPAEKWEGAIESDYISAIAQSYEAVQSLRDEIPFQPVHQIFPPRPDVIVVAPALFQVPWAAMANNAPKDQRGTVRFLLNSFDRQTGFRTNIGDLDRIKTSPIAANLLRQRVAELTLHAHAVGLFAASTLSAVVRVPPAVNRTGGVVRQMGRYARSPDLRHRKNLIKTFKLVQQRLSGATGPELTQCISDSLHGVKMISDAPLEWLPLGELPLGLVKNCSRLTSTPGDLLLQMLAQNEPLQLPAEAFNDILIISSFKKDDAIAPLLRSAVQQMSPAWGNRLNIKNVEVSTSAEFIATLNDWHGPLVVFDGHGLHDEDNIAQIMVGEESVDVWTLRGKVKSPPIVILSACDTQAAGMSHATTANGFLTLGARSVLATLLPVSGLHAAIIVARLMLRIAEFVPAAMKQYKRALTWSEIVSGLLRMNFLSDLMMELLAKKVVDETQYHRITTYGNGAINSLDPNWLDYIKSAIIRESDLSERSLAKYMSDTVATSDVIRYVQIGNPETIIVGDVIEISDAMDALDPDAEQTKFFAGAGKIARELKTAAQIGLAPPKG